MPLVPRGRSTTLAPALLPAPPQAPAMVKGSSASRAPPRGSHHKCTCSPVCAKSQTAKKLCLTACLETACLSGSGRSNRLLPTGWLKQPTVAHSSGGWQSESRVPAVSGSGEGWLPGLWRAILLLCPRMTQRELVPFPPLRAPIPSWEPHPHNLI